MPDMAATEARLPPMRITANGRSFEVKPGTTLGAFIRSRGLDPLYVVVERNGRPEERARYEEIALAEGDRLELVRAVAGG
jgi:thiamine biosynthesis protein ThiS